jgi:Fe-S cluster assembly ATP-binding protein
MLNPDLGVLLITHYQRILDYITPHQVHVLGRGRIIKTGGAELARELEVSGYAPILAAAGLEDDARDEAARTAAGADAA